MNDPTTLNKRPDETEFAWGERLGIHSIRLSTFELLSQSDEFNKGYQHGLQLKAAALPTESGYEIGRANLAAEIE